MIRYLLNGAFLIALSYLLIFNPSFEGARQSSAMTVKEAIASDITSDSLITFIRAASMSVSEMQRVLDHLSATDLMDTDRGQATCYALSKQAQQKINAGDRSKTLRNVIDTLAGYQMIVEIPQSDWNKLYQYSKECAFQDLHCDHLFNRVTGHPYFNGLMVLAGLLLTGSVYLLGRRLLERKKLNIKLLTE